ncbi:olfactory receptor 8B3-like [Vulpes lagopus]|uniref:olfactory receptor 8B3-like n=1 Tax=Vulpes lagopus TaxID=494514 RepID=UPI001BC9295A|nr:olfactory receptor 8B3-like [Vulpes lagopus]
MCSPVGPQHSNRNVVIEQPSGGSSQQPRPPAPRSDTLPGTTWPQGLPHLRCPAESHLGSEDCCHPCLPRGAICCTCHDHLAPLEDSRLCRHSREETLHDCWEGMGILASHMFSTDTVVRVVSLMLGINCGEGEQVSGCWKTEMQVEGDVFPKRRILVRNDSLVTEFLLAGLTDRPELQQPLFFLFLMIYIITMVGNLGLIILISLNSHLHTPMYYFLFNLSFIDLCYSSVFTPKMLMNFVSEDNIISYVGCMTQLFFFLFFVISECYMLTSMAYDRYVAICNPLLYKVTMSHQVCSLLTVAAYMMGFAGASAHTGCMLRLTFCNVNIINHYLCDILPLLQLSCTSTYVNEVVVLIVVGINITVPSFTILISYVFILTSIFHIKSAQGRSKAFSTCSSHIIALCLFFGSAAFMYLKYSSSGSMDLGKISSVFYTNVVPMLNPLIYSLRNKDIKVTLQKTLLKIQSRNMF